MKKVEIIATVPIRENGIAYAKGDSLMVSEKRAEQLVADKNAKHRSAEHVDHADAAKKPKV